MKRIFLTILLISCCIISAIPTYASEECSFSESRITNDDGSYYIITIEENSTRSQKSGKKSFSCYDSSNVLQWTAQLQGTFSYNGSTSSCTGASHSITISDTSWYIYSQNSYKPGSSAVADITMKEKFLGIVISTKTIQLKLTCDANGNLS